VVLGELAPPVWSPVSKSFGTFWVLQVSSPAVLLKAAITLLDRESFTPAFVARLVNYCGDEKVLSPHSFSMAGASAPLAPTVPTPLIG